MPQVIGMSFHKFLEYKPNSLRTPVCVEFWSEAERNFAYLDEPNRIKALNRYKAYLRLKVDDVTTNLPGTHVMTLDDANALLCFLKKHPKSDVVVHCDQGVSRTGACVYILNQYLGYSCSEHWNSVGRSEHYTANGVMVKKLMKALKVSLWQKIKKNIF